ncbi:hypothetical protein BD626DRAFT_497358 [Schizophyllum amplum]|uniref:TRIP4/RQT4 C2HC5-type zinc finger domain-containing protein n=1 Tax=Schizophyllum amplum TaxID=97359 RepID=A0A550CE17_9AGAR|nr:hypothetical protein BD626DRAFT_497358 [Auriculariopsis ampla]
MQHTPWIKSSSLPSDRIKPRYNNRPAQNGTGGRGSPKGKEPAGPPKSRAVRKLENQIAALTSEAGTQDPAGGCFCMAREHALSSYAPACTRCGLILCVLNGPQHLCPHCASPLLSPDAAARLIERLESELAATRAREEAAVVRAEQEARARAGAFPTLSGAAPPMRTPSPAQNQAHKVLSLNSRTKKATVTTFTPAPPPPPPAQQQQEAPAEPEPVRVPPPPSEPHYSRKKADPQRPWKNLMGEGARYVPPPKEREGGQGKRRRRKGKEAQGGDGGPTA